MIKPIQGPLWFAPQTLPFRFRIYLEGQGDLVSGSIRGISLLIIRVIGVISLLTKSP